VGSLLRSDLKGYARLQRGQIKIEPAVLTDRSRGHRLWGGQGAVPTCDRISIGRECAGANDGGSLAF